MTFSTPARCTRPGQGASLAEVMARLGHSTANATMRYQHAAKGRDAEIADALSKLTED